MRAGDLNWQVCVLLPFWLSKCSMTNHCCNVSAVGPYISHTPSLWHLGLLYTYVLVMLTERIWWERFCRGVSNLVLGANRQDIGDTAALIILVTVGSSLPGWVIQTLQPLVVCFQWFSIKRSREALPTISVAWWPNDGPWGSMMSPTPCFKYGSLKVNDG